MGPRTEHWVDNSAELERQVRTCDVDLIAFEGLYGECDYESNVPLLEDYVSLHLGYRPRSRGGRLAL